MNASGGTLTSGRRDANESTPVLRIAVGGTLNPLIRRMVPLTSPVGLLRYAMRPTWDIYKIAQRFAGTMTPQLPAGDHRCKVAGGCRL